MTSSIVEESTSHSLLHGLRLKDPTALTRVARIYGPLISHWCRRLGLQPADADDVCQSVLVAIIKHAWKFRKENPSDSFRKWLYVVTYRSVLAFKKDRARFRFFEFDDSIKNTACFENEIEPVDEPQVQSELLSRALSVLRESVREQTWQIFIEAISESIPHELIAERYDTTPGNVRVIKFRLIAKLNAFLDLTDEG